jgi:hypothetical protein
VTVTAVEFFRGYICSVPHVQTGSGFFELSAVELFILETSLEQRATDRATVTGRIDEEKVRLIHRFEIFVRENQSLYAVLISAWVDGLENLMSNTIVVRKVELSDDESRILRRNGKRVD